jgi:hypothetical protein
LRPPKPAAPSRPRGSRTCSNPVWIPDRRRLSTVKQTPVTTRWILDWCRLSNATRAVQLAHQQRADEGAGGGGEALGEGGRPMVLDILQGPVLPRDRVPR